MATASLAQFSCNQTGDVFLTAGIGQVDPALFDTVQNRANQVGEADRCRHVRVELSDDPSQIVQMAVGQRQRFQLIDCIAAVLRGRGHEVHSRKLHRRCDWRDQIPTPNFENIFDRALNLLPSAG